jgi:ClpP class serine protease
MYAMSGGTLLALSTDEIEMSQTACMGPVDPQLGNLFKYGSAASWDHIVKYKGKKAEDQTISFAMIGRQYTQTIKNHLDKVMTLDMTPDDKKKFINLITSGDIEHAFALTPQELFKMGVPIKYIKDKDILNRLMKFIIRSGNEGVTYA